MGNSYVQLLSSYIFRYKAQNEKRMRKAKKALKVAGKHKRKIESALNDATVAVSESEESESSEDSESSDDGGRSSKKRKTNNGLLERIAALERGGAGAPGAHPTIGVPGITNTKNVELVTRHYKIPKTCSTYPLQESAREQLAICQASISDLQARHQVLHEEKQTLAEEKEILTLKAKAEVTELTAQSESTIKQLTTRAATAELSTQELSAKVGLLEAQLSGERVSIGLIRQEAAALRDNVAMLEPLRQQLHLAEEKLADVRKFGQPLMGLAGHMDAAWNPCLDLADSKTKAAIEPLLSASNDELMIFAMALISKMDFTNQRRLWLEMATRTTDQETLSIAAEYISNQVSQYPYPFPAASSHRCRVRMSRLHLLP